MSARFHEGTNWFFARLAALTFAAIVGHFALPAFVAGQFADEPPVPRPFDDAGDAETVRPLQPPRTLATDQEAGAIATDRPAGGKRPTATPDAISGASQPPAKTESIADVLATDTDTGVVQATAIEPKAKETKALPPNTPVPPRFRAAPRFTVEQVLGNIDTGSLIAMSFDHAGNALLARENGPLLIATDTNRDGVPDTVETYCADVKNCHGILSLGGRVFVTAEGPQGLGLYRLSDSDRDGAIDDVRKLLSFDCKVLEHGPHGITVGPDGLLYIVVGNHAKLDKEPEATSPYAHAYEGDLAGPRFEDPNGMGAGIQAPAGTILRTDQDGEFVEVVAGGLRNPFDLAFSAAGELFTHDADMEWDIGLPWYRPTRVLHLTPGAEFGWRSGWAKWPEYFLDNLPAALNTGDGSPAGMVFYNHVMFPLSYQNALFSCDWAKGRILVVRFKPNGSSFRGESEVFVEGSPMNATDIAVGPDGAIYFTTGGRGTEGGLYRVSWQGRVPPSVTALGIGISAALRQPQIESAWARQRILTVREELGDQWGPQLVAAAMQKNLPVDQRMRALDLMQLFGPAPAKDFLVTLTGDEQMLVRAKAAYLLGIHGDETTATQLAKLIHDVDPRVGRTALEALSRSGQLTTLGNLAVPLATNDRHLVMAAMRSLERASAEKWLPSVLGSRDKRIFANASAAMLIAQPTTPMATAVADRSRKFLQERLTESDQLALLRVCELCVLRGELSDETLTGLSGQLASMYPQRSAAVNRELVRLLVHLEEPSAAAAMFAQFKGNAPNVEKIHVAMHLAHFRPALTSAQRFELLRFYEEARALPGGLSLGRYIERAAIEVGGQLTAQERLKMLREGTAWPTTALASLARLPRQPDADTLIALQQLDEKITNVETDAADRLRIGIVAVLSRSGDDEAMAYLRSLYPKQPERRAAIAMGLAQNPDGENWPLLVESLSVVDGVAAQEVLSKLAGVNRVPTDAEPIRQAILRGYSLAGGALGEQGGLAALALLEHWTGKQFYSPEESVTVALDRAQAWFAEAHPDSLPATPLPKVAGKWDIDELTLFLKSPTDKGNPVKGAAIYATANCAKCHRFGETGEGHGPDLTSVARRFGKREILEAILFPSHAVSDQYASKSVRTTDGKTFTGLVVLDDQGNATVRLPTLETMVVPGDEIDEMAASTLSSMPEGLLDPLSREQIADLFAYLAKPPVTNVARQPGQKSQK
ncbi:MAG: c-type cytochrome [Pirellulales bacterium]